MTDPRSTIRHPTENGPSIPTPPPSFISCGPLEKKLLRYLLENKHKRFNRSECHRVLDRAKSTIKYACDSLIRKGLAMRPYIGQVVITEQGEEALNVLSGGIGSVRRECRPGTLSQHYTRYVCQIKEWHTLTPLDIARLQPIKSHSLPLVNMTQWFLYYEDATIILGTRTCSIRIFDIVAEDSEESQYQTFTKAIRYVEKINKCVPLESIELDTAHYARVSSYLADFLSKIDNRYFLDLGNGQKFWVDNSGGKAAEDETNSGEVRERVDSFMQDMIHSEGMISDIDKMKEVLGLMVQLKMLEYQGTQQAPQPQGRPDYFG